MIRIVAIGKKHEDWIGLGLERYQKRLRKPFDLEWTLLPHSSLEGLIARNEESERLEATLNDRDFVVLLDERGIQPSSEEFAKLLDKEFTRGSTIVVIIGGAYGVNERLINRANVVVGLSNLVFPHQLVRLILTEQLYRAQEITSGGKYHHV